MPCSDSSSSICLKLDAEERFVSFDYAKITCGQTIGADTGLNTYLKGKVLTDILNSSFTQICTDLNPADEEAQFILYLEWDALRSAIAQYLGIDSKEIDKDRCHITSIEHTEDGIEVAQVILPPRELPKIESCGALNKKKEEGS